MKKADFKKITLSALFLALGIVIPLFTSQIKEIGDTLLPMHIPVMMCGLLCGAKYGLGIGLIMPFIRSLLFSMPPMYPNAVWMAFELATYGFVLGLLYSKVKNKNTPKLYLCLFTSMILGRIVWGIVKGILLLGSSNKFTLSTFISGGLIDAFPGIILQLILIPIIMKIIYKKRINK